MTFRGGFGVPKTAVKIEMTVQFHGPNSPPCPTPPSMLMLPFSARKGHGNTFTAKGIVERLLHMGRRIVVLDPLSVWWGLEALADG